MVTILMMTTKMAAPGLLKIKVFWNKECDVKIFVHDVTNKTLSRDSNYIVDLVMWPKFGNCSISIRKVVITSILKGFDKKNRFFWAVVLVQVQQFWTGIRYKLETLHQCGKKVKPKRENVLWTNSYVCRSYRGKTGRGTFSGLLLSWIRLISTYLIIIFET